MTKLTDVTVIGLCGITCSGKSSLSNLLLEHFKKAESLKNPQTIEIILMDDYFLPEKDPRHILIPELNHINWELMSSLDIDKMVADVTSSIERLKCSGLSCALLIIEGFLVLNSDRLKSLCDLKFFIDLDYNTCLLRRSQRVYDPPDVPGYFEKVVWPESQKNKEYVLKSTQDLHLIDGSLPLENNFNKILEIVNNHVCRKNASGEKIN